MTTRKFLTYLLAALLIGACSSNQTESDFVGQAKDLIDKGELRPAAIQLKNALQQNPDNPEARWLLGKINLEIGDNAAAEKELQRALELGVSDEAIRPLLARTLAALGKHENVLELQISGLSPEAQAQILATQASILLLQNNLDQAEDKITEALSRQRDSAPAITEQARLAMAREQATQARILLNNLLENNNSHAPAWSLLAEIERRERQPAEAETALNKAIENRFNNVADRLKRVLVRIELNKYNEAQTDIDILKQRIPKYYELHYAQGLLHFHQKLFSQALPDFEAAFNANNQFLPVRFYLGATHYHLGQYQQAENLISRFVSMNPAYPPGRKLLARIRLQEGKFTEMERLLQPVLAANDEDIAALNLLAVALNQQGKNKEGVALLEKIVSLQPESAEAHLLLGSGLLAQGEEEQGLQALEIAAKLDPGTQQSADELLVRYYLERKKLDQALTTAKSYQQRTPDQAAPLNLLGLVLLAKQENEAAKSALDKAREIEPGNIMANQNQATLALREQDYATARQHYNEILANHTDHLDTLMKLTLLDELQHQEADMVKHLKQAIAAHPKIVQPRTSLARYYLAKGEPEKVTEALGDLQQSRFDHPEVLEVLGQAQLGQRASAEARTTFNRLVELQPNSAQAHYLLALAYAQHNNAKALKAELEKSINLDKDHLNARLGLTRLLLLQQDTEAARQQLAALKSSAPDNPDVKHLEARLARASGQQGTALDIYAELFEDNANTTNMLALVQQRWNTNDREGAIALLEQELKQHPKDLTARLKLASAYTSTGQHSAASDHYLTILKQSPDNLVALNNLAWQLKDTNPKQALQYAEKANSLAPRSAGINDTLAVVLMKNGQHDLALRKSQALTEKYTNNPSFTYHRAMILAGAGRALEAKSLLAALLDRTNEFAERREAEQMLKRLQNR